MSIHTGRGCRGLLDESWKPAPEVTRLTSLLITTCSSSEVLGIVRLRGRYARWRSNGNAVLRVTAFFEEASKRIQFA